MASSQPVEEPQHNLDILNSWHVIGNGSNASGKSSRGSSESSGRETRTIALTVTPELRRQILANWRKVLLCVSFLGKLKVSLSQFRRMASAASSVLHVNLREVDAQTECEGASQDSGSHRSRTNRRNVARSASGGSQSGSVQGDTPSSITVTRFDDDEMLMVDQAQVYTTGSPPPHQEQALTALTHDNARGLQLLAMEVRANQELQVRSMELFRDMSLRHQEEIRRQQMMDMAGRQAQENLVRGQWHHEWKVTTFKLVGAAFILFFFVRLLRKDIWNFFKFWNDTLTARLREAQTYFQSMANGLAKEAVQEAKDFTVEQVGQAVQENKDFTLRVLQQGYENVRKDSRIHIQKSVEKTVQKEVRGHQEHLYRKMVADMKREVRAEVNRNKKQQAPKPGCLIM